MGPLLPQNFQLVDIGNPNGPMQLLYDMPIALGEPHYAQIIKADKLQPWEVYPEVGWDPTTQSRHPAATRPGEERIERRGNTVEIWMTGHTEPLHARACGGPQGRPRDLAHYEHRAGAGRHARLCTARL
nr:hypothetical protein [Rhodothermus marinus]